MGGGLTWGGSFHVDKDLSLLERSPRGRARGTVTQPKRQKNKPKGE